MSCVFILYVCSKEQICLDMDEPIPYLSEKEQAELLTIYGRSVVEAPSIFEKGVYFSVFYFPCFVKEISMDMLKK